MSQGLEVVPPRLLLPQVGVDAHVAGRPREALVLPVRNVLVRVGVDVFLGEAEVHDVDYLSTRRCHRKVGSNRIR